jgi:hypothetical protein
MAVYCPATATWTLKSRQDDGAPTVIAFGRPSRDVPVPGDYDGDGKADLAVYRPDVARWVVLGSAGRGLDTWYGADDIDVPVPGDYDGDGKADLAVFRPVDARWQTRGSRDNRTSVTTLSLPEESRSPLVGDQPGGGAPDSTVYRDRETATR